MPKTYRPITKTEKATQIGLGLFLAFIFASLIGFIAPFIFQLIAGIFDPAPNGPKPCNITDFLDRTLNEFSKCREQSDAFPHRMERLSWTIPWFWLAFLPLAWVFIRNALKGRMHDNSEDRSYPGQWAWSILGSLLGPLLFYILIWVIGARDMASFIALGVWISVVLASITLHCWLLKKYGKTKSESESP